MFRFYQELCANAEPKAAAVRPTPGVKECKEVKDTLDYSRADSVHRLCAGPNYSRVDQVCINEKMILIYLHFCYFTRKIMVRLYARPL